MLPGKPFDPQAFANMQVGKPYKSYRKTILGKVYVELLDQFTGAPIGYQIEGTPKSDSAIVDVWSEVEDVFFKRRNKRQFELGNIVPYERPTVIKVEPQPIEQYSDEQLKELLKSRFFNLQTAVNKTQSISLLSRLLELAHELEKSEKIIKFLEGRLSEVQMLEYQEPS